MPKISVVIPTYNNESFILEALESVFAQTLRDYEVIVVDDGSTDSTRQLLEPYGDRIRYHYQANQGLAVARNTGLTLARGDYLTYLDGDDAWEPHNLEVKAAVLARFPDLGGVFSEFSIFGSGVDRPCGAKHTFPFFDRTGLGYSDVFTEKHQIDVAGASADLYVGNVFEKLFLGNFILPTTMVFHRERALATGHFRAHMRTQQDYEYWLRFSRQHRFAYIDAPLARYRRHPQQLTNFRNIERILVAVEEIIDQYQDELASKGRQRVFKRRKAELHANFAKTHLRKGDAALGRRRASAGLSLDPTRLELYALYALSYVPNKLIARLRPQR